MSNFTPDEKEILLSVAKQAILEGFKSQDYLKLDLKAYPATLRKIQASFVTLEQNHQLRGCIGSLEARLPLIQDVAFNSFNAAFKDFRFSPLSQSEFEKTRWHISVLSSPEPMTFSSEADLISKLRPGIDGLILEDLGRRGTFLPSVWESLPTPTLFLQHLKQKAGLPTNHWSHTLKVSRYTTEMIE